MTKKKIIPGQAGGKAVLKKYGPDYFSKMSKKYQRSKRLEALKKEGKVVKKKRTR